MTLGVVIVPPSACSLSAVSVNETTETHESGERQHRRVKTQPGKIKADLFPKILPVEEKKGISQSKKSSHHCVWKHVLYMTTTLIFKPFIAQCVVSI